VPDGSPAPPAETACLPVTSAGAVGRRSDTRVAVAGPLSGPRAAWGELLKSAVLRHEIPGIVWELHDDRGDIGLARERAVQIVADGGYRVVVGHFNSLGAAAALPIYRSAGIPVLLPLSTGSGLLAGGGGGALRWCADDHGQLAALALAAHGRGMREVQVTDDGSANGEHLAATVCGLAPPSSLKLSVALLAPVAVGVNLTLTAQLAPGAMLAPQVLAEMKQSTKSVPAMTMPLPVKFTATVPTLVTVTVLAPLVVPTA